MIEGVDYALLAGVGKFNNEAVIDLPRQVPSVLSQKISWQIKAVFDSDKETPVIVIYYGGENIIRHVDFQVNNEL